MLSQLIQSAQLLESQLKNYETAVRNAKALRDSSREREQILTKELIAVRALLSREEATTQKLSKRFNKIPLAAWDPALFLRHPCADSTLLRPLSCTLDSEPSIQVASAFVSQAEPYMDFSRASDDCTAYGLEELLASAASHPYPIESPCFPLPNTDDPAIFQCTLFVQNEDDIQLSSEPSCDTSLHLRSQKRHLDTVSEQPYKKVRFSHHST